MKVHISEVHYRKEYLDRYIEEVVYADAVIKGKKVELRSDKNVSYAYNDLPLGDFQARLIKDPPKMGDTPIFQVWEIVLPDRTLWHGIITGMSE